MIPKTNILHKLHLATIRQHIHGFHIVEPSPWPLTARLGSGLLTRAIVFLFISPSYSLLITAITIIMLRRYQWWRDVARERALQGWHTFQVQIGIRGGMALFIISEVIFFFSFFWAYFNNRLGYCLETGLVWPPTGITPLNPFGVPLLNTVILLSSGLTVTACHHYTLGEDFSKAWFYLLLTVRLGLWFLSLQGLEYKTSTFTIADSSYGSIFFVATGFHGTHVIVGSLYLLVCLARMQKGQLSSTHHFGLEGAIWYWHFVDVVWIFLFISIYWWGR